MEMYVEILGNMENYGMMKLQNMKKEIYENLKNTLQFKKQKLMERMGIYGNFWKFQ